MDNSRRLAMRRAHTKHQLYCTCGLVVCGNGGRAAHRAMHERRRDGHRGLTPDAFRAMFPGKFTADGARVHGPGPHTLWYLIAGEPEEGTFHDLPDYSALYSHKAAAEKAAKDGAS